MRVGRGMASEHDQHGNVQLPDDRSGRQPGAHPKELRLSRFHDRDQAQIAIAAAGLLLRELDFSEIRAPLPPIVASVLPYTGRTPEWSECGQDVGPVGKGCSGICRLDRDRLGRQKTCLGASGQRFHQDREGTFPALTSSTCMQSRPVRTSPSTLTRKPRGAGVSFESDCRSSPY